MIMRLYCGIASCTTQILGTGWRLDNYQLLTLLRSLGL